MVHIRKVALSGIIVLCLFLAGCEQIREGEIYNKEFSEERTWIQMVPIVHTNGETSYVSYIPILHHHPDEWIVKIRSLDGEETAVYYVTEAVFDECEIGMMFEYDPDRGDLEDEPIEKREVDK